MSTILFSVMCVSRILNLLTYLLTYLPVDKENMIKYWKSSACMYGFGILKDF